MNYSSLARVWRCFSTTGVEEARTQLKEHLPECNIYLDEDDLNEDEDGLDEYGGEEDLDGDKGEDE